MHILFALCLLPFGALHFLPSIVAAVRHSRHTFAIFVLNVLFGWTVIGWIALLFWAATSEPKWRTRYVYGVPAAGWYPGGVRRF